ncbi:hypothetical protein Tco_0411810 [Tanacetum coccineum]
MLNVDIPQGIVTGGSLKRQETMGVLLLRLGLREYLNSPMNHLSQKVLDLEKEKDAQAVEILNLKKRVKKLERKRKSSISHPRRRKYRQVETSSDDGVDIELDDHMENVEEETVDAATTGVSTAAVTISTAEPRTPPSSTTVFDDEDVTMAMAQTLIKMKEQKAKEKGVAITDVEDSSRTVRPVRSITTLQPLPIIDPKDKAQRLHDEELAELERRQKERVAQEEASMATLYEEVFGYILLVIKMLILKKLADLEINHKLKKIRFIRTSQTVLRNVPWDFSHVRRLPGENIQVLLEQAAQLVATYFCESGFDHYSMFQIFWVDYHFDSLFHH